MPSLTNNQLAELLCVVEKSLAQLVESDAELARAFKSAPDKVNALIAQSDLRWSSLYEKGFDEHLGIVVCAMGLSETVASYAQFQGRDMHRLRLQLIKKPDLLKENAAETKQEHLLGIMASLMRTLIAKQAYGLYLNELVERVRRDGNQDAFTKAVYVDRSVLSCDTFARRLAVAELLKDQEFLGAVASAMKEPPKVWDLRRGPFRFGLQLVRDVGALDGLTEKSAYWLFCEKTHLYRGVKGQSPDARSLWKCISRWRSRLETKSREKMSS